MEVVVRSTEYEKLGLDDGWEMIAGVGVGDAPKVDCAWLAIAVMIACAICGARVSS